MFMVIQPPDSPLLLKTLYLEAGYKLWFFVVIPVPNAFGIERESSVFEDFWIPAFAGMTKHGTL